MLYKYYNGNQEFDINSLEEIRWLLSSNKINSNTVLLEEETGRYVKVSDIKELGYLVKNDNSYIGEEEQDYNVLSYTYNGSGRIAPMILLILGILIELSTTLVHSLIIRNFYGFKVDFAYKSIQIFGSIFIFLILWIIFWAVAYKKEKKTAALILSIVYLVFSIGFFSINAVDTRAQEEKLEKQSERLAAEKLYSWFRASTESKEIKKENIDKSKYGNFTDVLKITNDYYVSCYKLDNTLYKQIKSINIETSISGSNIGDIKKIKALKQEVNEVEKNLSKFEKEFTNLASNIMSGLEGIKAPKNFKNGFLKHSEDSMYEATYDSQEYLLIVEDEARKIVSFLEFLEKEQGQYHYSNGVVYFSTHSDADTYNTKVKEIKDLVAKEKKLIDENKNKQSDNLKNMAEGLKELNK